MARVGHKQKTANRGEAIMRNKARIEKLAEKIGEIGKEAKEIGDQSAEWRRDLKDELEVLAEEFEEVSEALKARLDLLERTLWRKMMDRIKKVKKGNPTKAPNRAVIIKDGDVRKDAHKRAGKEPAKKKGEK